MNSMSRFIFTLPAILLIIILIALIHPFGMAMPTLCEKMLTAIAVLLFGVISVFVWREHGNDERAVLHTRMVDRVAFLVSTGGLLIVVTYDVFTYMYDYRLLIILIITILVKVVGHQYAERHL